nr:MAG TPA: hypothetical protein [Bacteriophage sp.]
MILLESPRGIESLRDFPQALFLLVGCVFHPFTHPYIRKEDLTV